ncbi:MAG: hydantoinase/carbamoylase family amidase [Actinomycetota bacterium]
MSEASPGLTIDGERLLADLQTLRSFGATGTGVVRPSLSPIDLEARVWLRERMAEAGLSASIDGVGNVFGLAPGDGPALLVGSHSDTQPTGGWLDGALGTIFGLEVARAAGELAAAGGPTLAVDAVAWVDEEGTYGSCVGSRTYCGLTTEAELAEAANAEGETLHQAWARAGLDGRPAARRPDRHVGYIEAHIEQGANLERAGHDLGVVTSIVGSRNLLVTFTGEQNHAGTTPMPFRKDAAKAMFRLGVATDDAFADLAGEQTVWTMGNARVHPGGASIIPGRAELHVQFRDPDLAVLDAFEETLHALVAGADGSPCAVTAVRSNAPVAPAAMDPGLQDHLAGAAERWSESGWTRMPSAAVHDAMFLAEVMPAGMLFVPSIGGISHDFAEDTAEDDIVRGCRVMATATESILTGATSPL